MTWKQRLLHPPSLEDWATVLQAWRLWFVAGLLGALLGAAVYRLTPPPYRAQAEVIVDYNMEEAWPTDTDREMFEFLARENKKLEALAWSDAVLEKTATYAETPLDPAWRQGQFVLRDEHDGRWHFWVIARDAPAATRLARAWAQAFTDEVRQRVDIALALLTKRAALAEVGKQQEQWHQRCASTPPPTECEAKLRVLDERQTTLQKDIAALEEASGGISPYIEVFFAQAEHLPVERRSPLAAYTLTGALAGLVLALGWALGFGRPSHDH